jgi:hypothetical protein
LGHNARPGVIGLGSGVGADANPENPADRVSLMVFGFGQLFCKMYFPPGVIVSTPVVIGRPSMALNVQTVVGSN